MLRIPRGLTLIEVLAALAVLAVLLVGLLAAKGGAERQWVAAERRLQAAHAADSLLNAWWSESDSLPAAPAAGQIDASFAWQLEPVPTPHDLEPWGLQVVRLSVGPVEPPEVEADRWWATVDLLVSLPPEKEDPAPQMNEAEEEGVDAP